MLSYFSDMKGFSLLLAPALLLVCCHTLKRGEKSRQPAIMTVSGIVPADQMGKALIHEHVFLDWTGADSIRPELWDNAAAFLVTLPKLREMKAFGVETFFECTPNYLGRNPALLRRLADSTGLRIVTNTGYYGAVRNKYLPAHAFTETPEQLAGRWVREYEKGLNDSGIRPGFIKIGVDGDSVLSPLHRKLVQAAALTHLRTGLTIVAHTGPDAPAVQEANILESMGVRLDAWVWTHAQGGTSAQHVALARRGAWISLDGLGWVAPENGDSSGLKKYVQQIVYLKDQGLLHRTLISHDAGWYTHGQPGGGRFQPYTNIFTMLIPALKKQGFTTRDIEQLLVKNPQEAFTIRVRRMEK
ncbi:MAG: Phosphotriesterase homology protein [Saprospiraceae bacterium]|nr:Phosphotriesterase homology protein [Saprospiraceae bacterium]